MGRSYLKNLLVSFLLMTMTLTAIATETSPFNDKLKEVPNVTATHENSQPNSIIPVREKEDDKTRDLDWNVGVEFQRSPVKNENLDPIRRDSVGGVVKGYFHF